MKIRTKSPRKERLSIEQVSKIKNLDIALFQYLPLYRDLFLFSIMTCLAYRDLVGLKLTNLESRKEDNYKLAVKREKTDVITESFLPRQAIDIVLKYKKNVDAENGNNVFPYRSNKEVNSLLKLLAQLAGISILVTMHTARHTFRQLLAE